jgi:oxygen-independent coproporphyrinogen-3 oxidase
MESRRECIAGSPLETVYFGGGTPSLYHPARLQRIIDRARNLWTFSSDMEITVEVNPEDATDKYLEALARTDINRISFGVQSFIDSDLAMMGRRHDGRRAIAAIMKAREVGFRNLALDLIYGIPGMSGIEWEKNVLRAVALGIDHLSAYCLTVEPGTPLAAKVDSGLVSPPDEEECCEHYLIAHDILTSMGFDHYEVSNYSRDVWFRSRHNSNYWCGHSYLGIGPSAHSYDGKRRYANVPNVKIYVEKAGTPEAYSVETLSRTDRYNEYIMVSLRTSTGVQRDRIARQFGLDYLLHFEEKCRPFLEHGLMHHEGNEYKIPPEKFLLADAIIRKLFIDEEEQ